MCNTARFVQNVPDNLEGKENILALMAQYRDEWKYRDQTFITMFWRFIYLSLIITFLPNFMEKFNVNNEFLTILPILAFSLAGIACALFGLFLTLGECARIKTIDSDYKRIMKMLPTNFQQSGLDSKKRWRIFSIRLNNLLCVSMFTVVILLAVINIFLSIR